MTKILVVSDSHTDEWQLRDAIESEPQAKVVFFLGDGVKEAAQMAEEYKRKFFHIVAGNCDWGCRLPESATDIIEGKRIYACHGHTHLVKHGIEMLADMAKRENYDLVLYGHTHEPRAEYINGVLLFNPGSVSDGKFGVIDIAENGILPSFRNLR